MYDHPFQWGSKRTGPDLARVGGRYSNEWQVQHLTDPRSLVPESLMPKYGFLSKTKLQFDDMAAHLRANQIVGVPYSAEQVENVKADVVAQATGEDIEGLEARYTYDDRFSVPLGDFDGNPDEISEMDALVAYLQMLGTLVDFSTFVPDESR